MNHARALAAPAFRAAHETTQGARARLGIVAAEDEVVQSEATQIMVARAERVRTAVAVGVAAKASEAHAPVSLVRRVFLAQRERGLEACEKRRKRGESAAAARARARTSHPGSKPVQDVAVTIAAVYRCSTSVVYQHGGAVPARTGSQRQILLDRSSMTNPAVSISE